MLASKFEIAEKIASTKKSNVHGGVSIIKSEDDLIIFAGGVQGTRETARLSCIKVLAGC